MASRYHGSARRESSAGLDADLHEAGDIRGCGPKVAGIVELADGRG
jgi:hypothetical protein